MREAADAKDVPTLLAADRDFHMTLMEAAGSNRVLRAIFRDLQALLLRSFSLPLDAAKMDEIYRQHETIADAVADGRGDDAEEVLRVHIARAAETDLAQLAD